MGLFHRFSIDFGWICPYDGGRWLKVDQSGGNELKFEFTGTYNHGLDGKGRLTLPSAFRSQLDGPAKFSLALDKNCIVIHPKPVWHEWLAKLKALPRSDARAESVKRVILSSSFDCEVDAQGRTVVPPRLRELVGIGREVALVGNLETVEIWDRGTWTAYFKEGHERLDANTNNLPL